MLLLVPLSVQKQSFVSAAAFFHLYHYIHLVIITVTLAACDAPKVNYQLAIPRTDFNTLS